MWFFPTVSSTWIQLDSRQKMDNTFWTAQEKQNMLKMILLWWYHLVIKNILHYIMLKAIIYIFLYLYIACLLSAWIHVNAASGTMRDIWKKLEVIFKWSSWGASGIWLGFFLITPVKVFQACPPGRWPRGRPWARWTKCESYLACKLLGIHQEHVRSGWGGEHLD